MARIKTIPYEKAKDKLKQTYDERIAKRGRLSEVLMFQTLHRIASAAMCSFTRILGSAKLLYQGQKRK